MRRRPGLWSVRAVTYTRGEDPRFGGRNPKVTLFILDDAVETGDWERIDTGVELTVRALNTALGSLSDIIDPIG
jgi:hypothetical protein